MSTVISAGVLAILKHVPKTFILTNGILACGKDYETLAILDEPRPEMKSLREVHIAGETHYTHKSNVKWLVKMLQKKEKKNEKRQEKELKRAKKAVKKGLDKKADKLAKNMKKSKKENLVAPVSEAALAN